ncbi:MAG: hypothetical protein ALAOOOJD_01875 [bacterium]|nr:hypothetical protein [bacterium]
MPSQQRLGENKEIRSLRHAPDFLQPMKEQLPCVAIPRERVERVQMLDKFFAPGFWIRPALLKRGAGQSRQIFAERMRAHFGGAPIILQRLRHGRAQRLKKFLTFRLAAFALRCRGGRAILRFLAGERETRVSLQREIHRRLVCGFGLGAEILCCQHADGKPRSFLPFRMRFQQQGEIDFSREALDVLMFGGEAARYGAEVQQHLAEFDTAAGAAGILRLQVFLRCIRFGEHFPQPDFAGARHKQNHMAAPWAILQKVEFFGHDKKVAGLLVCQLLPISFSKRAKINLYLRPHSNIENIPQNSFGVKLNQN